MTAAALAVVPTKALPTVTLATPEDRQSLFDLMLESHDECAMSRLCERKLWEAIDRALDPMRTKVFIGRIGEPGHVEAMVGLYLTQWFYAHDDDWHLQDWLTYVRKPHRKSNHAVALLHWVREFADNSGLPVILGVLQFVDTQRKVDFFARHLPQVGAVFMYGNTAMLGKIEPHSPERVKALQHERDRIAKRFVN